MSRDYVDYLEEDKDLETKDTVRLSTMSKKLELSFKSKNQLKREVWDNARARGWLSE